MANNFNILDFSPGSTYDVAGTAQGAIRVSKRTATGPASYTQGTGIVIDLSAAFATLLAVRITRAYVTATLADASRIWRVHEAGTDLFANRKFRLLAYVGNTPVGTNAAALFNLVNGGVGNSTVTIPAGNGQALAAGLTGGAGASTGHTGIQAAAFTGTAETVFGVEVVGAVDLSTITVEYEAVGIV